MEVKSLNGSTLVTRKVSGSALYRGAGEFLTNNHVINPDAWKNRRVFIETDDGKKHLVAVLWNDPVHDLAKLSVAPLTLNLPILSFAISKNLRVADQVFSVGYPFGTKTYTQGVVAALDAKLTQRIVVLDITFNGGVSGGASFTCEGQVIGINVAKGPGLGFIIPIDLVAQMEVHFDKFKTVSYGSLGITYLPVQTADTDDLKKLGISRRADERGMLVTAVKHSSAAEKSGLTPGDTITTVNNLSADFQYQFARKVFYSTPGTMLVLTVRKPDGKEVRLYPIADEADQETIKQVAAQLNILDREL